MVDKQEIQWTKEFTLFLKGLAIFMIVGHNFFHWVGPDSGFNEMSFQLEMVPILLFQYTTYPLELINTTFDFFGHYGVQIFVFISGVGLARAYGRGREGVGRFLVSRISKMYLSMLLAFAFFLLKVRHLDLEMLQDMLPFLSFMQTFIPGKLFVLNGPWWFYSLIVQLYLLFPLLYRFIERYQGKGVAFLMALSYLAIFGLRHYFDHHDLSIFATFFGHLPEFVLGIACALTRTIVFRARYCVLAALVFCAANAGDLLFPFQFIAAAYGLVYLLHKLYGLKGAGRLRGVAFSAVEKLGGISLAVFAVSGFLRTPLTTMADSYHHSWYSLALFVAHFILVLAVACVYVFIFNRILAMVRGARDDGLRSLETTS